MVKNCLKYIGGWFANYWKDILLTILLVIIIIGAFFGGFFLCWEGAREQVMFWEVMTTAPEPTSCALCGTDRDVKHHAPCIVNLSSGEIAELSVYQPHPTIPGEVTDEIKTGYFSFSFSAGANIMQSPELEKCEATLPKEIKVMQPEHYCYDCRRLLSNIDKKGYVIVDLYDDESIGAFKIYDGGKYTIRDYIVTVHKDENRLMVVEVHGGVKSK